MKNVKNFDEFINEGVFSKQDDIKDILDGIYYDIKNNFNPSKISRNDGNYSFYSNEIEKYVISYTTSKDDDIKILSNTADLLFINDDRIENKACEKITKLLRNKLKDIEKEKQIFNKKNINNELTKKYSKYKLDDIGE